MTDRKKLKKEYQQTLPPMGIFQIKNKTNGKVYLGFAKNLPGIINSHKFSLKMGSHYSPELQSDYNKLGEDNFSFEVLDYLEPKEGIGYDYTADLKALEEIWLEKLQPFGEKGYHTKG